MEKGIKTISPILKSFNELEEMRIPFIIECILEKAPNCFKLLLINEIEDPTVTIQEQNPYPRNKENEIIEYFLALHKEMIEYCFETPKI